MGNFREELAMRKKMGRKKPKILLGILLAGLRWEINLGVQTVYLFLNNVFQSINWRRKKMFFFGWDFLFFRMCTSIIFNCNVKVFFLFLCYIVFIMFNLFLSSCHHRLSTSTSVCLCTQSLKLNMTLWLLREPQRTADPLRWPFLTGRCWRRSPGRPHRTS